MKGTIVIIGASFAGISCALEAANLYPESHIILIEKEKTIGFIPSGLNLTLAHKVTSLDDARFISADLLRERNIDLRLETMVTKVDVKKRELSTECRGIKQRLPYDKLVLAMGSHQGSHQIEGANHPLVVSTKTYEDSLETLKIVHQSQRIVVVGGGQIGLEAAQTYQNLGKDVTLIEALPSLAFKYFDEEMIAPVQKAMTQQGVQVITNRSVVSIKDNLDQSTVPLVIETSNQETIEADMVLLGVNLRPNSHLVKGILDRDVDNTIRVDDYLRTSDPHVFAIGDLIRLPYGLDQEKYYLPLVNHALITGQMAAINLFKPQAPYKKSTRSMGTSLFGYYMASVGLTQVEAETWGPVHSTIFVGRGMEMVSAENTESITIKLITSINTGQILGAQLYSKAPIFHVSDILSLAISADYSDQDLALQERAYVAGFTDLQGAIYQATMQSFEGRLAQRSDAHVD